VLGNKADLQQSRRQVGGARARAHALLSMSFPFVLLVSSPACGQRTFSPSHS
jgi:hypothetical protein